MVLLEAFQHEADVTLLTGAPVEIARLNRAYHTAVDEDRLAVSRLAMPKLFREAPFGDEVRGSFLDRRARTVGKDYDLCVSAYNFVDFGRPSIQFVADFSWDDEVRNESDLGSMGLARLVQRPGLTRDAYLALAGLIRGGRGRAKPHARDILVANSHWSAELMSQRHGLASRVIYPPVYAPPACAGERSGDFVLLGRISPEKRVLEAMDVLSRVRERGHRSCLHIIGDLDGSAYSAQVRSAAESHGDWVRLHGGLYGPAKFAELAKHSFALHTRRQEAFGIAVAEMVKSGLVPFVYTGGAPAEIIDEERLIFSSPDHAVDIIDRVMRDGAQLAGIRQHLRGRAALFSKEIFVRAVRGLFDEALRTGSVQAEAGVLQAACTAACRSPFTRP